MTGKYTARLGTQSNVIYWDTPWSVPLEHAFVSERLQAAGYDTALFGKWHLGMHADAFTPLSRGFGAHVGYYQGCESAFTHVAARRAVWKSNLQLDVNVSVCGRFDASSSVVLREFDESHRFVQKSAESTSN